MIEYWETRIIGDEKLRPLYEALGWVAYINEITDLQTLFIPCQLVYSAGKENFLVGIIRTVGGGISIQDLLVLAKYQKLGIGKKLLDYVLEKSQQIRQVVLITDGSNENQYMLDRYKRQRFKKLETFELKGFLMTSRSKPTRR